MCLNGILRGNPTLGTAYEYRETLMYLNFSISDKFLTFVAEYVFSV